jgi:hypothetical protein
MARDKIPRKDISRMEHESGDHKAEHDARGSFGTFKQFKTADNSCSKITGERKLKKKRLHQKHPNWQFLILILRSLAASPTSLYGMFRSSAIFLATEQGICPSDAFPTSSFFSSSFM